MFAFASSIDIDSYDYSHSQIDDLLQYIFFDKNYSITKKKRKTRVKKGKHRK